MSGGSSRRGQEQEDSVSAVGTPELEHLVGLLEVTDWRPAGGLAGSQEPTEGKSVGTTPRSMQAESERKVPVTCVET